jgi:hypothetical protein
MAWLEKSKPTPLDGLPIHGLYFLDGDQVAHVIQGDWTKGQKYPVLAFPSGLECDLWSTGNPDSLATVHLFGEMDLPLADTRDEAYRQADDIAEQCGYLAHKVGEDRIEVVGHDTGEHLMLVYDNDTHRMVDVQPIIEKQTRLITRLGDLLDSQSRAKLPPLYSGEEQGLEAQALVKFFTPDSHWTWYASEFDGKDIFFGLVAGDEIELGYFSLSELEQALGPLGLAIDRDRYFSPKTLQELRELHQQERR